MSVLHLDFETFAHVNLKAVGVWQYVKDPNFEVTCMAWAFDDGPVKSAIWPDTKDLPEEIADHLRKGGEVHAWNSAFEYAVLTGHYGWALAHSKLVCTMQRALVFGLPAGLEEAGKALRLNIIKDATARRLMLSMSKPKKDGTVWHRGQDVVSLLRMGELRRYCIRDVEAEREVGRHVPDLSKFEKQVSLIDALTNEGGVQLDAEAIKALTLARERIRQEHKTEVTSLTGGAVVRVESEVAKLQSWLRTHQNVHLVSLDKEHIAEALEDESLPPGARKVLEIRQAASKSSLGKLDKMKLVQGSDGRARGLLQYYGAGRTGRWAGRLVQVQNLPRNPDDVDPDAVLGIIRADPAGLDLFYEKPLKVLSACLRGCLTAAPGKLLAMIDLSQIEARVLAWLAGQEDVLETFRRGEDIYTYQAAAQGSTDRNFGKVLVLACGYGMGPAKFVETAASYGVDLTMAKADLAVQTWREKNHLIQTFWWEMQRECIAAVKAPGKVRRVRRLEVVCRQGTLKIRKPNGEVLYYHEAHVVSNPKSINGDFTFWGLEQKTNTWMELRTYGGKFVENVTQSVARDVMAEAMVLIEQQTGMVPVMSVHDELVYEVDTPIMALVLQNFVNEVPAWAKDLPIASKLHCGFRYGK